MRAVLNGYHRLLKAVLTLLMAALIVPVAMQILSRYTGVIPRFIWTEEIARFCFVWIILVGSMIAVRDGTHFDVDVLPHSARPGVELAMTMVVIAAMLAVALTFVVWGYDFAVLGSRQQSEIAGLPMLAIYGAWPLAGATWIAFLAERAWDAVAAYRAEVAARAEAADGPR